MKKTLLMLTVLALAVPAMAAVSIDVNDLGGGVAAIQYTADTNMVAFGLKVSVDAGTITAVSPNHTGESTGSAKGYGIFLGTIDINSTTGAVDNYGSPVAPNSDPGASGTGLDTNTVVLELGALYEDGNQPPLSGTLCLVTVSDCCKMTVTVDATRCGQTSGAQDAGAVQEDGTAVVPTLTGATDVDIDYNCGGCACPGDMDDNGWKSPADVSSIITILTPYASAYYWKQVTPGVDDCGDMDDNGWISPADVSKLITELTPYASAYYWKQCP